MSIGSGIALIVIGAIITFAINIEISWIDLDIVGSILMGAGLVIFILGIVGMTRKRQVVELHVRVALLNRFTQIGHPTTVAVPAMA